MEKPTQEQMGGLKKLSKEARVSDYSEIVQSREEAAARIRDLKDKAWNRRGGTMPDEPVNGREPEFSEEDIQREQLGPRGVPSKESPAKLTPQAEKNMPKDPDTGHTK